MNGENILVVSMTNRNESLTLHLAREYVERLEAAGIPANLYSLTELPANFLVEEMYGRRSEAFMAVESAMAQAEFYLFVVPEYNGSYPGVGKVFIDAMPREIWKGKTASLAGASSGRFGNARGLDHLNAVLNYLQVTVLPFRAHYPYLERILEHDFWPADAETEMRRHVADIAAALRRPVAVGV